MCKVALSLISSVILQYLWLSIDQLIRICPFSINKHHLEFPINEIIIQMLNIPYWMLCALIVNIELLESDGKWVDVIRIVAMFTIVAINHNFCNTNHNKKPQLLQSPPQSSQSDQPHMSQLQSQLSRFFENEIDPVNVYSWLKDDFSLSVTTLTIFFTILSLFCPVNLPQYICSHIIAERKSGHFLCKAYCFITIFAVFLWRENIPKLNLPVNWRKTCSRILQMRMPLTVECQKI